MDETETEEAKPEEMKSDWQRAQEAKALETGQEVSPPPGNQTEVDQAIIHQISEEPHAVDNHSSGYKFAKAVEAKLGDRKEIIGFGAEKDVYKDPTGEDRVVAHFRSGESIFDLKIRFYMNKVLHQLCPDHIPDIHLTLTNPPLIVLSKMTPPEDMSNLSGFLKRVYWKRKIEQEMKKYGVFLDRNNCNFVFDKNGSLNYIDNPVGWDSESVEKAVRKKFKGPELEKALKYIERVRLWRQKEIKEYKRTHPDER